MMTCISTFIDFFITVFLLHTMSRFKCKVLWNMNKRRKNPLCQRIWFKLLKNHSMVDIQLFLSLTLAPALKYTHISFLNKNISEICFPYQIFKNQPLEKLFSFFYNFIMHYYFTKSNHWLGTNKNQVNQKWRWT